MKVAVVIARTSAGWHLVDAGGDIAELKSVFKLLKVAGSHDIDGAPADLALYFDTSGEIRKKVLVSPAAVAAKTAAVPAADPATGATAPADPATGAEDPPPADPAPAPVAPPPGPAAAAAPSPDPAASAAPDDGDIASHFAAGKPSTGRRRGVTTSAPGSAASVS
ncbi:hypothetical protein OpiT1DRAFT_00198 [Opitutaceae bacterium TAV1]|nr:hypothetical protein OpiT1DRAFT_00198 [Opitutaceae bacterium TAV1]